MPAPSFIARPARAVRIFLCGDVMTGRGIDQVLPHPGDPELREDYLRSAVDYVRLAEASSGPIARPTDFAEIWGAARDLWLHMAPEVRIMNLETAITESARFAPKGINYRMHPANTPCLQAAAPDVLTLANNHVLDFGQAGLRDTLRALRAGGIRSAGAGRDRSEARASVVIATRSGRLMVYALAAGDSGVPIGWSAATDRPGVAYTSLSDAAVQAVCEQIKSERCAGDLAIVSIHWGSNWGYAIPQAHRRFAHALIDSGQVALVHGHSSHHPRPVEVYKGRLILYGCGDFLNDYEGIRGREAFRDTLVAMYFADLDPSTGELLRLLLAPLKIHRFRLNEPSPSEARWLATTLSRESRPLGVEVAATEPPGLLEARWRGRSERPISR